MDERIVPQNPPVETPEMVAQAVHTTAPTDTDHSVDTPPVTPVRSAKDAINAMYAQSADKRLSNYLATSAKEIINAGKHTTSNNRSAANLHRGSIRHKVESARPSASGLLKPAQKETIITPSDTSSAMDPLARKTAPAVKPHSIKIAPPVTPVVKTSLKLGPKKAPVTMAPQSARPHHSRPTSTPTQAKGQTALAKLLANRRNAQARATQPAQAIAHAATSAQRPTSSSRPSAPVTPRVPRPRTRAPRGLMQDIVRPATSTLHQSPVDTSAHSAVEPTSPEPTEVIARATAAATRRQSARPLDSVKRRFRPAPKSYTATATTQNEAYIGYQQPTPEKPPVDIYGLMDDEPTGKPADLGVVHDYKPAGDEPSNGIKEQKIASGSGSASPNEHKYAIKGQSPLFLKSVNVEKRPLSDSPRQSHHSPKGTLYERPSNAPLDKKNIYEKTNKKSPKATLPTKPTVIIPASRRSKAPLIFLLILTVILGAAVGAFVYLFFFQYLD